MKNLILITTALFSGTISFCQDNAEKPKAKSFLEYSGGYSMMGGNITKTDYMDNTSGFAQKGGYTLGLNGAYFFNSHFGIGGLFSMTNHYTAGGQNLSDGYKNDFDVDSVTVTPTGSYKTMNFMIGLYYSLPMGKLTIDFRLLEGLTMATTPKWQVDIEDQAAATFSQNSAKANNTFGFQGGVGLRYALYKGLCVSARVDYFSAKPNFTIDNTNRANNAGRLITSYNESFGGLQATLGVAYQFGK